MSINPCIFHENPTWKDHARAAAIAVVQSNLGKPILAKWKASLLLAWYGTAHASNTKGLI